MPLSRRQGEPALLPAAPVAALPAAMEGTVPAATRARGSGIRTSVPALRTTGAGGPSEGAAEPHATQSEEVEAATRAGERRTLDSVARFSIIVRFCCKKDSAHANKAAFLQRSSVPSAPRRSPRSRRFLAPARPPSPRPPAAPPRCSVFPLLQDSVAFLLPRRCSALVGRRYLKTYCCLR